MAHEGQALPPAASPTTRTTRPTLEEVGIRPVRKAPDGVVLARLISLSDQRPTVLLPDSGTPVQAAAGGNLRAEHVGGLVAVMFLDGDLDNPMVVGPIVAAPTGTIPERLEICANSELVLRCGPSTLRLLADGTAVLRGTTVTSRASGTNRIRGGNVQIN